ncbi:MAG: hypothetical protein KKF48_01110 [Nanoarchaeota archaeon]|nr:hypothetical protein [Nanoarchaeota archaeon]MBU1027622.1 hypothetical protein [Nanoarchaeota archaeon]
MKLKTIKKKTYSLKAVEGEYKAYLLLLNGKNEFGMLAHFPNNEPETIVALAQKYTKKKKIIRILNENYLKSTEILNLPKKDLEFLLGSNMIINIKNSIKNDN